MELMRYEPILRLTRPDWLTRILSSEWLDPFLGESESLEVEGFVPAVDIHEKDNDYILEVELPGLKKEDIHIDLKDGVLTLTGERKFESEDKRENFTRVERCFGSFSRSFTIPEHVETDRIDAAYKDGVLTLTLPKGEAAKPKSIEVKVQ